MPDAAEANYGPYQPVDPDVSSGAGWATAGAAASAAAPPTAQAALRAASNPDRSAAAGATPTPGADFGKEQPTVQYQPVPIALKPKRAGLLGVVDKIADALAGTQTPEIYVDGRGNEFVANRDLSRGEQWMHIAGNLAQGAAAGLAAGRGRGPGAAGVAGFQVAEKNAQQAQERQQEMTAQARQANIDYANSQMNQMKMADLAWQHSRLQIKSNQEDVTFDQQQIDRMTKPVSEGGQGAKVIGTAPGPDGLADVLKTTPDIARRFVKDHSIRIMPLHSVDGHEGVAFLQMPPNNYQTMLPPGALSHQWDPNLNKIVEFHHSDSVSQGAVNDEDNAAQVAKHAYELDQANLEEKQATTRNLESEASARDKELPGKIEETKAATAKNWAEAHKANMEAANLPPTGGDQEDTESEALALFEGRSAVSLMNKRAKNYSDIMRRADEISMERTGHKYDRATGETAYLARQKLIKDYTDGDEAASIESFDKFLGHAQEASEAINNLRNTNSRLVNIPINKIEKMTASKRGPALQAAMVKFQTLRNEFETALKNNHALTVEDIKEGQKMLDENVSLAVGQEVMRSMAHVATVRLRASDFKYSRTMRKHVPDLTSEQGNNALRHFGIDPRDAYSTLQNQNPSVTSWTPPPDAPPAPQVDNKILYDLQGKALAKSMGGKWVQP